MYIFIHRILNLRNQIVAATGLEIKMNSFPIYLIVNHLSGKLVFIESLL